jgi:hypothetical protein
MIAQDEERLLRAARRKSLAAVPDLSEETFDQRFAPAEFEYEEPIEVRPPVAQWEAPTPFYEHDLPSFPVDALPACLRVFNEELAREVQVPVDLPAVLSLGIVAACVAHHVRVQPRKGWTEPTNIYEVVILPSGTRKSAAFSKITEPLEQIEREEAADAEADIAKARSEYRMLEQESARLEKEASRADNPEDRRLRKAEAVRVAQELAVAKVPASPRRVVDDVTPETLATIMADQGERICLMSPEGGIFETVVGGRYSNGVGNFALLLKSYSGDSVRIDRRGLFDFLHNPALTMVLAVQPDVIQSVSVMPGARGRGLLARPLFSMPVNIVGRREIGSAPVSDVSHQTYVRTVRALAAIEPLTDPNGKPCSRMLYLTRDADKLLRKFERELEPRLAPDGELGSIADWASKLAGAIVRLSGILWLAENAETLSPWPEKISVDTVRRAVTLGEYFTEHAKAVFAEMGSDQELENARLLLRWIKKSELTSFSKRDAHQAHRARFKKVADLEPALDLLESHRYIREQPGLTVRGPGRKPSQTFNVNPLAPAQTDRQIEEAEAMAIREEGSHTGFFAPEVEGVA